VDQVALAPEDPVTIVGQVAPDLVHSQPVRNRSNAGDLHLPRRQLDEEQHQLQAAWRPSFDSEEVGGNDQVPVLLKELLPGSLSFTLWRRFNSIPRQDLSHRASTDVVPQIGECTLNSSVAPGPILIRQPHDQVLKLLRRPRSSGAPIFAAVVLLCDQTAMPGQQRLRSHNRAQLAQQVASEPLRLGSQPAALVVCEPQSLVAQLFPQDPILFSKIVDEE